MEYNLQAIDFLDLTIFKHQDGSKHSYFNLQQAHRTQYLPSPQQQPSPPAETKQQKQDSIKEITIHLY